MPHHSILSAQPYLHSVAVPGIIDPQCSPPNTKPRVGHSTTTKALSAKMPETPLLEGPCLAGRPEPTPSTGDQPRHLRLELAHLGTEGVVLGRFRTALVRPQALKRAVSPRLAPSGQMRGVQLGPPDPYGRGGSVLFRPSGPVSLRLAGANRTGWGRPDRDAPVTSPQARAASNRASNRLQARSACASW